MTDPISVCGVGAFSCAAIYRLSFRLQSILDGAEPQWWADIQRARLDSELLRRLIDDATKQ